MTSKQEVNLISLNVNGLGNPVKRAKVMSKLKKERAQIHFLQETHLSKSEHEKLKKFGYKHTYYSSHTNTRKRGVAILISNQVKFECQKEIRDKEGRFVIVKGIMHETQVTLVNIYAPPDSDKQFFKMLFDSITLESEGICWCAGDLNVVIDYDLDTTSLNRSRKPISKLVKNTWEEMGFVDVWRDFHPLQRDYSHFSQAFSVHSRLDYIYTQKENIELIQGCHIGIADVSDHSAVHMKVCLSDRKRNTIWRLNAGLLNNKEVVEQIKVDIGHYLTDNNNGETSPAMLWDALKAVIRGKLIAISSKMKKEKQARYKQLISDLTTLEQKHKLKADRQIFAQMTEVRKQINMILQQEVDMKTRYLKQSYYEAGPRAAKLLARRLRKQQADRTIHRLVDPKTNQIKHKQHDIEHIFKTYYEELYTQTPTSSEEETKLFLDRLDLPSIGVTQNKTITRTINMEEIKAAIGRAKTGKTPGSDGFPSEWYKKFEKELSPLLCSTFNWVKENDSTPPSWKEAVITVLPKPGKDKTFCQNFRPISLLNVDYKLYTSILSERIQSFISDMIDEDQAGFILGRKTQDNIRRSLHIMHKINNNKIPAAMVSLDARQAFDKVSHRFLFLTLERFGFNERAIQCIKTLYVNPTARIKVNGSLTDRFDIEQGCRQGCNLSPSLFAFFIEPLAQMIRENERIEGIEMNGEKHVVSLFADDVLVHLKNPLESFEHLLQTLDQFTLYSGYTLNKSKTQILMLNCKPNQKLKDMDINWKAKSIRYLGINIPKKLSKLYVSNYDDIDNNIKKDIERWSTYPMGFSDRIQAIKMNVLPRLLYLFQSLPIPVPSTQFIKWDKLISRFIWDGKRPRIRYSTLQLPKDKGGMALPNLKEYFHAAQICPLLNWCSSDYIAKWKNIEIQGFSTPIQTNIGERKIRTNIKTEIDLHPITSFTLDIWYTIVKQLKIGKELSLLKWIAYDEEFRPGRLDLRFRRWVELGVTAMCLLIRQGEMRSFEEIKKACDLTNQDFFRYLQIRDYYNKSIKQTSIHPLVRIVSQAYGAVTPRAISVIYSSLMASKNNSTIYVKNKWEKELDEDIPEEVWDDMWEKHQTTTQSKDWREFTWKNQIRYFITPQIKNKQLRSQQPCWRKCNHMNPNHTHVFWNCVKVQPFWQIIRTAINEVIGYEIPCTCLVLYLGYIEKSVHSRDQYLVKIMLAAGKKAITKNWLKEDIPDYNQWRTIMDNIENMERLTFRIRIREDLYEKRWEKWSIYKLLRGELQ